MSFARSFDVTFTNEYSGLSLRNPNDTNIPLVAGDAQKYLGDDLDAYLVGNVRLDYYLYIVSLTPFQEPDLYTTHGNRPNLKNYTVNDYIGVSTTRGACELTGT